MTGRSNVQINSTNFPDRNFRDWLLCQEYGKDAVLTDTEIADVHKIEVSLKKIQSLKGIEYLTALTDLDCSNNRLTSLDVSACTALNHLLIYQNQIKGEAMEALINSLPTTENGLIQVLRKENEQNVMTTDQAAAAKAKGWSTAGLPWSTENRTEAPGRLNAVSLNRTEAPDRLNAVNLSRTDLFFLGNLFGGCRRIA